MWRRGQLALRNRQQSVDGRVQVFSILNVDIATSRPKACVGRRSRRSRAVPYVILYQGRTRARKKKCSGYLYRGRLKSAHGVPTRELAAGHHFVLARKLFLQGVDRPWSSDEREYGVSRGMLWRTWFGEWVRAARYLSLRQLIHERLLVERFYDKSGEIFDRLHEDLELEVRPRSECSVLTPYAANRSAVGLLSSGGVDSLGVDRAGCVIGSCDQAVEMFCDGAIGYVLLMVLTAWDLWYAGGHVVLVPERRLAALRRCGADCCTRIFHFSRLSVL